MTYPEALEYLDSFINYEKKDKYDYNKTFKIDRIREIASCLGNPQDYTNAIHVAGTKGKGSTSAFIYSILKESGFKVGLYTSPHLVSFRERIRINDALISEGDVGGLLDDIKKVIDRLKDNNPSFFEVYTALAYLYFKEKKVDFAVYETGLGGRLDATNILNPLVSCITPISYEHTDKLGSTLCEIAVEKAGIIKEKSICVSAPQEAEALRAIEKVCDKRGSKLILVGRDISCKEIAATGEKEVFNVSGQSGEYTNLNSTLLGHHQMVNAATAIGAVEALGLRGITISEESVRRGIESCRWPGRLEVVGRSPLVVLDGAQNRASALALADSIKKIFKYKKLIMILGVSKDKDIKGMLEELVPISDSVILTKSKIVARACEPSEIKKIAGPAARDISLTSGVEEALSRAKASSGPEDLILVTGSLFVVGEAREKLCPGII